MCPFDSLLKRMRAQSGLWNNNDVKRAADGNLPPREETDKTALNSTEGLAEPNSWRNVDFAHGAAWRARIL